jgi:hypothetical protein
MAFRIWTTNQSSQTVVACEGHLDDEAMASIERTLAEARRVDADTHLRLTRGTTADRAVVARLARYAPDQLQVDSPFLRLWIDEWRDTQKDDRT